jgi:hypothetical protein
MGPPAPLSAQQCNWKRIGTRTWIDRVHTSLLGRLGRLSVAGLRMLEH